MSKRKQITTTAAAAAALAATAGGVALAGAAGGDDAEAPMRGSALERASEAATEHLGGGQVTETEAGDEESAYEVEVTRADGSQVDVQLDRQFDVVGSESDDEAAEDRSGEDD